MPPALEAAWLRRLRWEYEGYNYLYAKKRLRPPLFGIGRGSAKLGEWNRLTRCLTIAERHILSHSWKSVLDTLRHEMAHQYVDEVLGGPTAGPHDAAFVEACRILRVEPSATAAGRPPGSLEASPEAADQVMARVKKLLALAGSPNEHEATSAMRMANRLMLEYNLDAARLSAARGFETRWLGASSRRIQQYEYTLAHILQEHFFVEVIWTHAYDPSTDAWGRILEVAGTRENLQMAEYAYHFVLNLTRSLWRTHQEGRRGRRGTRTQYLAGLLRGLEAKLNAQRDGLGKETGLVWKGDPLLREFHRIVHPRIVHRGGSGVLRTESFTAGLSDGRAITIHAGLGASADHRGRLLPPGRS